MFANTSHFLSLQLISYNQCLISNISELLHQDFNQIVRTHQIVLSPFHRGIVIKLNYLSSFKRYLRDLSISCPQIQQISLKIFKLAMKNRKYISQQKKKQLSELLNQQGAYFHPYQIRQIQEFVLLSKRYIIGDDSGMDKTLTVALIIKSFLLLQRQNFQNALLLVPSVIVVNWSILFQRLNLKLILFANFSYYNSKNIKQRQKNKQSFQVCLLTYEQLKEMKKQQKLKMFNQFKLVIFDQISHYLFKFGSTHESSDKIINEEYFEDCQRNIQHIQYVLISDSQAKYSLKQYISLLFNTITRQQLSIRYFMSNCYPSCNLVQFWRAIKNGNLYVRNSKNMMRSQFETVYIEEKQTNFGSQIKDDQCLTQIQIICPKTLKNVHKEQYNLYQKYCKAKARFSIDYIKYKIKMLKDQQIIWVVYSNQIVQKQLEQLLQIEQKRTNQNIRLIKINQLCSIQMRQNQILLLIQLYLPEMKQKLQKNITPQFMFHSKVQILKLHTNPFKTQQTSNQNNIMFINQFLKNNTNFSDPQNLNKPANTSNFTQFQNKLISLADCRPNFQIINALQNLDQANSTNSSIRGQIDSLSNSKSNQINQQNGKTKIKIKRKTVCINLDSDNEQQQIIEMEEQMCKKKRIKNKISLKKKTRIVYFDAQVKQDAIRILSESQESFQH